MNKNENGNKGANEVQVVSKETGGVSTTANDVKNAEGREKKQTENTFAKVSQIHVKDWEFIDQ